MGAGCGYSHKNVSRYAAWVEIDDMWEGVKKNNPDLTDEDDFGYFYRDTRTEILAYIEDLGYNRNGLDVWNGMYNVTTECTYYSDGIVIYLEPWNQDVWGLAVANHERSYRRILKTLLENGYQLRQATGNHTSREVTLEEFK